MAIVAAVVLGGGCAPIRPVGPIAEPAELKSPLPRSAWLEPLQIEASGASEAGSRQLTMELRDYISHAGYFRSVSLTPASYRSGSDVTLRFKVTEFGGMRYPHPAYFPLSVLTATIYIWANGAIYIDRTYVGGELCVLDSQGKEIVTVTDSVSNSFNVGLYSGQYAAPDTVTTITQAFQRLLDKAYESLSQRDLSALRIGR